MAFHWLNKQGFESSAGYALQRTHRFYYHYKEEERIIVVYVESSVECTVVFWDGKAKWRPPHDAEQISPQKLTGIKKKISDALTFMNTPHIFKSNSAQT
jgi:hypothetical protein